jgi:hypothetical protein
VHPVTKQVFRFWFESPVVSMPTKDDAPPGADTRLYPRDCREGVSGRNWKAGQGLVVVISAVLSAAIGASCDRQP